MTLPMKRFACPLKLFSICFWNMWSCSVFMPAAKRLFFRLKCRQFQQTILAVQFDFKMCFELHEKFLIKQLITCSIAHVAMFAYIPALGFENLDFPAMPDLTFERLSLMFYATVSTFNEQDIQIPRQSLHFGWMSMLNDKQNNLWSLLVNTDERTHHHP